MLDLVAEVVLLFRIVYVFRLNYHATQTLKRHFKLKPKSAIQSKYRIDLIDMFITEDNRIGLDKFC